MRGNSRAIGALLAVVAAVAALGLAPSGAFARKLVQLTVVNKSSTTFKVSMCDPPGPAVNGAQSLTGACPEFDQHLLAPGKSAHRTHEGAVTGVITTDHGPSRGGLGDHWLLFTAENPFVGKPFINIFARPITIEKEWSLSEGQLLGCLGANNPPGCGTLNIDGFHIVLYRDADTDRAKVLNITVTHVPQ